MDNYKTEEIIIEYYKDLKEDKRIIRDKSRMLEYFTTLRYIYRYLKDGDKIIEIGCATGIYSLDIARKGHEVTSVDISNKNLDVLRSKITENMNIEILNVNATNLVGVADQKYDVTLLFGPLYHLFSEDDINSAIKEAKRVTKTNGLIFIAFLVKDYIMMKKFEEVFEISQRHLSSDYRFINDLDEVFYYFYLEEFEELMKYHNLKKQHLLMTDGISRFIAKDINNLSEEGYQKYMNYILSNCERRELMGYSGHLLYIAKNNRENS